MSPAITRRPSTERTARHAPPGSGRRASRRDASSRAGLRAWGLVGLTAALAATGVVGVLDAAAAPAASVPVVVVPAPDGVAVQAPPAARAPAGQPVSRVAGVTARAATGQPAVVTVVPVPPPAVGPATTASSTAPVVTSAPAARGTTGGVAAAVSAVERGPLTGARTSTWDPSLFKRSAATPETPPSSPDAGMTDCASLPSRCGYPDATNTGPTRTGLKRVPQDVSSGRGWHWDPRGWVAIDGAGAVFSGYSVAATVDVQANDVTVSDVDIYLGGETWGISLRHSQRVTIQDVRIAAPNTTTRRLMAGIGDVYGDVDSLTIRRCDISGASTGIQVHAGLIEDNYVHDLGLTGADHVNGFTSNGGTRQLTIRHNTVLNQYGQTDAVSLFQDFGPQRNRLITDNLLGGGGYSLYAGANPGKESTATNIVVTNNRFSRKFFPRGGYYGPYTAYTSGGGNIWSGNTWDDTGATVL